ncbi:MAG: hypothetical protein H6733_12560 [Alphaproteobacteria bacterium]|nr:hypothetical protein [Alphaproteobacteria bacterium]
MRIAGGTVLGLALFAGTAEVAVRLLKPTPRLQVVHGGATLEPGVHQIRVLHGEPVWDEADSAARQDPGCAPGATDVVLLGSSILWGTGYPHDEVVSHYLQADLAAQGSWCVRNHAQPAFVGTNKLAVAEDVLPRVEPAVVVWEVWANDAGDYTLIGDDAYNVGTVQTDADGWPVAVPGVPTALHHWLFQHSRAWNYLTLAAVPEAPGAYEATWGRMRDTILPRVLALTEAHHGKLLLVFMPFLDKPFAASVAFERDRLRGYQWVHAWAEAHGVATIDVAQAFVDRDPVALRNDPCCHYNPAGHEALAALLAPTVRRLGEEGR